MAERNIIDLWTSIVGEYTTSPMKNFALSLRTVNN